MNDDSVRSITWRQIRPRTVYCEFCFSICIATNQRIQKNKQAFFFANSSI